MVNSIVSLVTLPNPTVTSDPGFDSSASADTWELGMTDNIRHTNITFILFILLLVSQFYSLGQHQYLSQNVDLQWGPLQQRARHTTHGEFIAYDSIGHYTFRKSKNVNWISLIIPNDAQMIQNYLNEFSEKKYVPKGLEMFETNTTYFDDRYITTSEWIKTHNHAVISNGPFYLSAYSPESRTIVVKAFDDKTYPFKLGYWSESEKTEFPKITSVNLPSIIQKGMKLEIDVSTNQADSILYFLTDNNNNSISETIKIDSNSCVVLFLPSLVTSMLLPNRSFFK